jgi:hypothetical protein
MQHQGDGAHQAVITGARTRYREIRREYRAPDAEDRQRSAHEGSLRIGAHTL